MSKNMSKNFIDSILESGRYTDTEELNKALISELYPKNKSSVEMGDLFMKTHGYDPTTYYVYKDLDKELETQIKNNRIIIDNIEDVRKDVEETWINEYPRYISETVGFITHELSDNDFDTYADEDDEDDAFVTNEEAEDVINEFMNEFDDDNLDDDFDDEDD